MLSLFSSHVILPLSVLPLVLMLASCAGGADDDTLLVFAATSLTDTMTQVAAEYEAMSGTNVEISFGPSRALAQQIVRGANPDLYFAAGQPPMDLLQDGGQVAQDGVARLLSNRIVLITGMDTPVMSSIDALADSGLNRIAMPDPEIAPAGNYTRTALQNLGLWDRLLPSIVFANDVRATLEYVESGNADGGFLYQTDAATSDAVTIQDIVPLDAYPDVVYPAAVIEGADTAEGSKALLEFLPSDAAREVFRMHGFTPLE